MRTGLSSRLSFRLSFGLSSRLRFGFRSRLSFRLSCRLGCGGIRIIASERISAVDSSLCKIPSTSKDRPLTRLPTSKISESDSVQRGKSLTYHITPERKIRRGGCAISRQREVNREICNHFRDRSSQDGFNDHIEVSDRSIGRTSSFSNFFDSSS